MKTIKYVDPITFEEKIASFSEEHFELAEKILTLMKGIDGFDATHAVIADEKNLYVGLKPSRNVGDPESKYFYRITIENKKR